MCLANHITMGILHESSGSVAHPCICNAATSSEFARPLDISGVYWCQGRALVFQNARYVFHRQVLEALVSILCHPANVWYLMQSVPKDS